MNCPQPAPPHSFRYCDLTRHVLGRSGRTASVNFDVRLTLWGLAAYASEQANRVNYDAQIRQSMLGYRQVLAGRGFGCSGRGGEL